MAARRLIMILLVLLFVSSLTAALVPIDRSGDSTDGETTTTTQPAPEAPAGKLVHARIDTRDERSKAVRLHVGDELALLVSGHVPDQVEIARLDLLEPIDLGAPARFELLADAAGTYPIRLVEANRVIARIVVSPPSKGKRPGEQRRASESGRKA